MRRPEDPPLLPTPGSQGTKPPCPASGDSPQEEVRITRTLSSSWHPLESGRNPRGPQQRPLLCRPCLGGLGCVPDGVCSPSGPLPPAAAVPTLGRSGVSAATQELEGSQQQVSVLGARTCPGIRGPWQDSRAHTQRAGPLAHFLPADSKSRLSATRPDPGKAPATRARVTPAAGNHTGGTRHPMARTPPWSPIPGAGGGARGWGAWALLLPGCWPPSP